MEITDKESEMATDKTTASTEAWESGELGQDEQHVGKVGPSSSKALDEALNLRLISIRLPKTLINDLKIIGKLEGIGYQPLIRQLLMRFVIAEKKRVLQDALADTVTQEKEQEKEDKRREKKAAQVPAQPDSGAPSEAPHPQPAHAADPAPEARELADLDTLYEGIDHKSVWIDDAGDRKGSLSVREFIVALFNAYPKLRAHVLDLQQALARAQEEIANYEGICNAWKRDLDGEKARGDAWMADCKRAESELAKVRDDLAATRDLQIVPWELDNCELGVQVKWPNGQQSAWRVEIAEPVRARLRAALASAPSAKEGKPGEQSEDKS